MTSHSLAQQQDQRAASPYALKKLSMEELLNIEVTSVSRTTETLSSAAAAISGYAELDVRLAWQAASQLEFTVTGQNLLHPHHVAFGTPEARGEIERSVEGKVLWHF